jgi:hypothetical protein
MPQITNVNCGNDYTTTAAVQDVWNSRGGWFTIAGAGSAFVQQQYGVLGMAYWTDEVIASVGTVGTLAANCTGVRFRNAVAGTVAVVSVGIAQGKEPVLDFSAGSPDATSAAFTIVGQGHKTGTNGTPTALGSSLACASVVVRAMPTNVGLVYVGTSTVTTSTGYELSPGDAVAFDVGNVAQVYFDVDTTSEGVSWMAVG